MTKDYGRPPRADENRMLIENRLKEVAGISGAHETLTIDWRGNPIHLDVIQLPIGGLYYNPATHRIRAQRSHDANRDRLLEQNPWSSEAQEYLHYLLKASPADTNKPDPDFDGLADSLKNHGQTDPGLVTRDGVLVNGNTRRAALLDLHGPPGIMRLAVLPESCGWDDITAVELSLQLRKDHRRDYSFINHLLAIEELLESGEPIENIATIFRVRVGSIQRDQWILACIRSMIERSGESENRIPVVAFEDHAEKLKELYRRYSKDMTVDSDKAELVKESRLTAMLLGFSKTDIRFIEPDFQSRYLNKRLPVELKPSSSSAPVAIPGLNRSVKGASQDLAAAKALTDKVLKMRALGTSASPNSSEATSELIKNQGELREVVAQALELAGKQNRLLKRKQAAPNRLQDAREQIDQCVTDLILSRSSRSLDEEAYDDSLLQLRKSLEKLAKESERTVEEPGDGLNWLIDVFATEK